MLSRGRMLGPELLQLEVENKDNHISTQVEVI